MHTIQGKVTVQVSLDIKHPLLQEDLTTYIQRALGHWSQVDGTELTQDNIDDLDPADILFNSVLVTYP